MHVNTFQQSYKTILPLEQTCVCGCVCVSVLWGLGRGKITMKRDRARDESYLHLPANHPHSFLKYKQLQLRMCLPQHQFPTQPKHWNTEHKPTKLHCDCICIFRISLSVQLFLFWLVLRILYDWSWCFVWTHHCGAAWTSSPAGQSAACHPATLRPSSDRSPGEDPASCPSPAWIHCH